MADKRCKGTVSMKDINSHDRGEIMNLLLFKERYKKALAAGWKGGKPYRKGTHV